jgi:hypothetical protein
MSKADVTPNQPELEPIAEKISIRQTPERLITSSTEFSS